MRNVAVGQVADAILRGYKSDPIRDVRLIGCTFDNVAKPGVIESGEGGSRLSVRPALWCTR